MKYQTLAGGRWGSYLTLIEMLWKDRTQLKQLGADREMKQIVKLAHLCCQRLLNQNMEVWKYLGRHFQIKTFFNKVEFVKMHSINYF